MDLIRMSNVQKTYKTGTVALYDVDFPALCVNWCQHFRITERKGIRSSIIAGTKGNLEPECSETNAQGQTRLPGF